MKSILFKPEMIQAILDRRKTQTRRVIKPQPSENQGTILKGDVEFLGDYSGDRPIIFKPKYKVGDIVYVKETYTVRAPISSDQDWESYGYETDGYELHRDEKWKSPLFMPERAARIFLEITDVKVERLNEISEEDAISEGVNMYSDRAAMMIDQETAGYTNDLIDNSTAKTLFVELWDSINAKTHPWESNPWVFAYTFKTIKP